MNKQAVNILSGANLQRLPTAFERRVYKGFEVSAVMRHSCLAVESDDWQQSVSKGVG